MEYMFKTSVDVFAGDDGVLRTGTDPNKTKISINVNFRVMWSMCMATWNRLGLSKSDINIYFEETPSYAVWQSMVLHNFQEALVDMRLDTIVRTTNTLMGFSFISNRSLFEKMMLKSIPSKVSRLCLAFKTHVPFLPEFTVSNALYTLCLGSIVEEFYHDKPVTATEIVQFIGVSYIPVSVECGNRICLTRVIPDSVYRHYPRESASIVCRPPRVTDRCGNLWYALPESILISESS